MYNPLQNRPVRGGQHRRSCLSPSSYGQSYAALSETLTQRRRRPSQLAANLSPKPFPGLPIGRKRAFPLLTVSAPNSSQKYISLQNRRDDGDLADHVLPDLFDAIDRLTCHHVTTGTRDSSSSSGRRKRAPTRRSARRHAPPPQAPLLPCFVIGGPPRRRVMHPHLKHLFVISDRTGDFHESVHRLCGQKADLPLSQLCRDPFDASPTKLRFVYTPRTAPTASIFEDLGRGPLDAPILEG